jgi:exopolysaccharide biosynthesis WecB/TagA/CpsF family protein
MHTERKQFLGLAFDCVAVDELLSHLSCATPESVYSYVVTPNVDHLVRLHKSAANIPGLADAYRDAAICLCDSKILSRLSRWYGVELPVIAGSDLTLLLFERVIRDGDRIGVVGGSQQTIDRLRQIFPRLEILHHRAPMGLATDLFARSEAAGFVAGQKARFTFICVGSPQQELIAAEAGRLDGSRGTAFCVGASLEFITGHQRRAPMVVRDLGLEWAHRLCTHPRRLWRRYLVDGPQIFAIAYRWRRTRM